MKLRRLIPSPALICALSAVSLCLCQQSSDPWPATAMVKTADLAATLKSGEKPPAIICVAFPILYRAKHITGSTFAGPGAKAEGIDALKKAVAGLSKDTEILLYCGCCPMDHCPNLRPAFRTLAELGYKKVKVLDVPTNMQTDWYSKDYPTELGPGAQ